MWGPWRLVLALSAVASGGMGLRGVALRSTRAGLGGREAARPWALEAAPRTGQELPQRVQLEWEVRQKAARASLKIASGLATIRAYGVADEKDIRAYMKEQNPAKYAKEADHEEEEQDEGPSALATAAFVAAGSAVLLRVGGRAALLNILGLDMLQDEGLRSTMDQVLQTADDLGPLKFLFFLAGWTVAKVFCLDFISVFLALTAGILFGGVVQGTLVSCTCAATGSAVAFFLGRKFLAEKVRGRMDEAPGLRAIENAVASEGFRAVFTLRLAPVIPLPVGAYSWIYGITRLRFQDFYIGTFLGSIKPYLLDSYLGVFGKSIVDAPESASGMTDVLLVGTFAAVIAVGTFASRLATATLGTLQEEMSAYKEAPPALAMEYVLAKPREEQLQVSGAGGAASLSKPIDDGLLSSLAFWGILAEDLPRAAGVGLSLCDEAQGRLRQVFEAEWEKRQYDQAQKRKEEGEDTGSFFGGAKKLSEPAPFRIPSYDENRKGLNLAESVMFVPVFIESLGRYSEPERHPEVLNRIREEGREALEARDERRNK